MIKRWRYETPPAVTRALPQYAPILMMTIGVANQCIQNQILCHAALGQSGSFGGHKHPVHYLPNTPHGMTGLTKFPPQIVTMNDYRQHLVAVDQFPAVADE